MYIYVYVVYLYTCLVKRSFLFYLLTIMYICVCIICICIHVYMHINSTYARIPPKCLLVEPLGSLNMESQGEGELPGVKGLWFRVWGLE